MKNQIFKMLLTTEKPCRRRRREGKDYPWKNPVFAVTFAIGKLSRIVNYDSGSILLSRSIDEQTMAEEMREAASYLLRAASLLDPDDDGREANHAS